MKTLSTKAILIDRDGYVSQHGVTVIEHPATAHSVATIQIGVAESPRDELTITDNRITSKAGGWKVIL